MALPKPSARPTPPPEEQQEKEAFERTLSQEIAPSPEVDAFQDYDDEEAYQQEVAAGQQTGLWRKVALGVAAVVLLGGIGTGAWFLGPGASHQEVDKSHHSVTGGEDNSTGKKGQSKDGTAFWHDSLGNPQWPVNLGEWEKTPATVNSNPGTIQTGLNQKYATSELYSASHTLPSKASGFTSDPKAATNADGTVNPRFSFLLAEDMQTLIASDLEFFTNPLYGDWVKMEYAKNNPSQNFPLSLVADKYSRQALAKNQSAPFKQWVPIYADWDGNDYGMKDTLLSTGPRWIGQVTSTKTTLKYDQTTLQYTAHVVAQVTYTAWTQDGNTTTKKGIITLDYITNTDDPKNTARKMLISNASLSILG